MADIDRLTAQVDADTLRAEAAFDRLDRKADKAAENRVGTVKFLVDDSDFDRPGRDGGKRGGILGSLFGGDGDKSSIKQVIGFTDELGDLVTGLGAVAGAAGGGGGGGGPGGGAASALSSVGSAASSAAPAVGSMGTSLVSASIGVIGMVTAVAAAGAALVTLGGGAVGLVAALAPLVGLLGVLPGLFMGLAGGAAVLMGAFSGITEALTEESASAKDAERNLLGLERAQLSLEMAEVSSTRAARDYADARRDAGEAIEDAQFSAISAQLGEERAILGLERAYKRLTDVQSGVIDKTTEIGYVTDYFTGKTFEVARVTQDAASSQDDLRDAQLGVQEAELGLAMARDRREDTEINLLDLQTRGIEGSDILIDRTLALASATLGLAEAQQNVVDANKMLPGESDAMTKLTEEGQEFVATLLELKPLLDEFKKDMQEVLLPFATESLENLKPLLQELSDMLTPVASAIGTIFTEVSETMGSETFIDKLTTFFDKHAMHIESLGVAFGNIATGLLDMTLAAEPLADFLFGAFGEMSESFADWAAGNSEMGDLTEWFELTATVLDKVMSTIGNLWVGMTGVVDAATPFGTWILDGLVESSEAFKEFTNSAEGKESIAGFFERIQEPLAAIASLAGAVLTTVVDVFGSSDAQKFLTNLATTMEDDILPVMGEFFDMLFESGFLDTVVDILGSVGEYFIAIQDTGAVDQLAVGFAIIGSAISGIIDLVAVVIRLIPDDFFTFGLGTDAFANLVGHMISAAGEVITTFFAELPVKITEAMAGGFVGMWDGIIDALEPIIDAVGDLFNPVIDTINKINPGDDIPKIGLGNDAPGEGLHPLIMDAIMGSLPDPVEPQYPGTSRVPDGGAPGTTTTNNITVNAPQPNATPIEIADEVAWSLGGGGGGGSRPLIN